MMPAQQELLSQEELLRVRKACPVKCPLDRHRIQSLADFMATVSSILRGKPVYWFRGHRKSSWRLTPSALRYAKVSERERAFELLAVFRRVAEIKIERPPRDDEHLKWMQLAQHYGIPTPLLDWTQSATYALYFACEEKKEDGNDKSDGVVFLMDPENLAKVRGRRIHSLDGVPSHLLASYLKPRHARFPPTVAINPVWNSDRLVVQRGVFTLHGSPTPLSMSQVPSLYAIPVLRDFKPTLLEELGRIGVDEMTIFPELEHACSHLKRGARLE